MKSLAFSQAEHTLALLASLFNKAGFEIPTSLRKSALKIQSEMHDEMCVSFHRACLGKQCFLDLQ